MQQPPQSFVFGVFTRADGMQVHVSTRCCFLTKQNCSISYLTSSFAFDVRLLFVAFTGRNTFDVRQLAKAINCMAIAARLALDANDPMLLHNVRTPRLAYRRFACACRPRRLTRRFVCL
jgi:hypothetical protein